MKIVCLFSGGGESKLCLYRVLHRHKDQIIVLDSLCNYGRGYLKRASRWYW